MPAKATSRTSPGLEHIRLAAHVRRKQRVGLVLSLLVTFVFFFLVVVMALRPGWLAGKISDGSAVSVALVSALGVIAVTFAVMVAFVAWRDRHLDDEARAR